MDLDLKCSACGSPVLDVDVKCGACGATLASTGSLRLVGNVVLGQYEILEVLGQGGMSVVYKGKHQLTGQDVALKILPPELAAHAQVKSRFLEEARALAQLDHPNIVHLYNFGEENGCFILAMQFVPGQTLERMIWVAGQLDWRLACRIGIDTLRALEYAHSRGIVHRDMKPSNVLVRDADGAATVMDFGIAKMTTSSKLTATGQTMGTVRYMSPEQVRGHTVDPRTDIYSLAVSLYEAVVGHTPFDGETHFEIMTKHLSEMPVAPSKSGADIPPELEVLLMKSMAKNPDDRPSSAGDLAAALGQLIAGESIPRFEPPDVPLVRASQAAVTASANQNVARPTSPDIDELLRPAKSRRWMVVAMTAIVLAAAAAALAVSMRSTTPTVATIDAAVASPVERLTDAQQRFPDPYLLPDLAVVANEHFEDVDLRIVTTSESMDPRRIRDEIKVARDQFSTFLRGQGVRRKLVWEPLSVVVVAPHLLCDPRLYEGGKAQADCADLDSHYRPTERTLYAVEIDDRRARALPYDIGLSLCLHRADEIPNCERSLTRFLRANEGLD